MGAGSRVVGISSADTSQSMCRRRLCGDWGWSRDWAETRIAPTDWPGGIEYLHYDFGPTATQTTISGGTAPVLGESRLTAGVIRADLS